RLEEPSCAQERLEPTERKIVAVGHGLQNLRGVLIIAQREVDPDRGAGTPFGEAEHVDARFTEALLRRAFEQKARIANAGDPPLEAREHHTPEEIAQLPIEAVSLKVVAEVAVLEGARVPESYGG